jgi:hypothetical protein
VAKRQIAEDTVSVGITYHSPRSERATPLRTLARQQVSLACVWPQNFTGCSYFKALGYCLARFNTFCSSHIAVFLKERQI